MIAFVVLAGLLGASHAVGVSHNSHKYVRTEPKAESTVTASGSVEAMQVKAQAPANSSRRGLSIRSLLEIGSEVYEHLKLPAGMDPAEICHEPDNHFYIPCSSCDGQGGKSFEACCTNAANFCFFLPRVTQNSFAMYVNCLRDSCACQALNVVNQAQDSCTYIGGFYALFTYSLRATLKNENVAPALSGAMTGVQSDWNSISALWDSSIPTTSPYLERPCAIYGNAHLLTFDRIQDPALVTEAAITQNYNWLTAGTYWVVRDPNRIVSIQGRFCSEYSWDSVALKTTHCEGQGSYLRSLTIGGRFLQGHYLKIDHRSGGVHFDGWLLSDSRWTSSNGNYTTVPGSPWFFKWPANCNTDPQTPGSGCLVFIQETMLNPVTNYVHNADGDRIPDLMMEVVLPYNVTMTISRQTYNLNAVIRMNPINGGGGQDGVCGNFDGDLNPEFGTAGSPGGDNFTVDDTESMNRLPQVVQGTCCTNSNCTIWWTRSASSDLSPVSESFISTIQSSYVSNYPTPCLPLSGLHAWFPSFGANASGWKSMLNEFVATTKAGTPVTLSSAGSAPYNFLVGAPDTKYYFGEVLPEIFTICTISRYNGPTQNNIFEGTNTNAADMFYWAQWAGFHGAAYFGGWAAPSQNLNGVTYTKPPNNMRCTDWLVSCGSNAGEKLFMFTKDKADAYGKFYMQNRWPQKQPLCGPNASDPKAPCHGGKQGLYVNSKGVASFGSDFAIAEVIVYDRLLSDFEFQITMSYLKSVADNLPTEDSSFTFTGSAQPSAGNACTRK